jgi:hypothetical protein
MTMIMVSYRRSDAQDMAGRITDYLIAKYDEKSVFFDVESIAPGVDYRRRIESAIRESNVMIAVIGPHWVGQRADGKPRIFDPGDPVRIEIETALQGKVPIFPLLVNGAAMPEENELPEALAELHYNNAAKVDSGQDFRMHMGRIVASINASLAPATVQPLVSMPAPPPQVSRVPIYAAGAALAVAALAVVVWFGDPWSSEHATTPASTTKEAAAVQTPTAPVQPAQAPVQTAPAQAPPVAVQPAQATPPPAQAPAQEAQTQPPPAQASPAPVQEVHAQPPPVQAPSAPTQEVKAEPPPAHSSPAPIHEVKAEPPPAQTAPAPAPVQPPKPPVQTATAPVEPPVQPAPASFSARVAANGGFVFPDSDRRMLREDEFKGFSSSELRIARNEIFARHGRKFADESLAAYFSKFNWYHATSDDVPLNQVETANVATIQNAEHQR